MRQRTAKEEGEGRKNGLFSLLLKPVYYHAGPRGKKGGKEGKREKKGKIFR